MEVLKVIQMVSGRARIQIQAVQTLQPTAFCLEGPSQYMAPSNCSTLDKKELKLKQFHQPMHSRLGWNLSLELTRKWTPNFYIPGLLYNLSTTLHLPLVFSLRKKIINLEANMGLLKLIFTIIVGFDFRNPALLTVKDDVFLGRETYAITLHICVKH